jgi:hypothetical protein
MILSSVTSAPTWIAEYALMEGVTVPVLRTPAGGFAGHATFSKSRLPTTALRTPA